MKIAFLGLGHMGQAMAGRLIAAGHAVAVYNRTPAKARALVRQGATLAAAGIVIGLAGAAAAAQAVQSLLFVEARGFDPLTFAGSAVIIVVAALIASYLPARRAARVSPVIALGR